MPYPSWLAYTFAALMIAVSVYCLGRLVLARRLGRRNHTDVNIAHVLMGFAMVGMLVPDWNVLPVGLWEVVFAVMAIYFLYFTVLHVANNGLLASPASDHVAHPLIHMVMACSMLYMYWLGMPMSSSDHMMGMSMSGAPSTGDPLLTAFLAIVLLVSAIRQLDVIGRFSPSRTGSRTLALSTVGAGSAPTNGSGSATGNGAAPMETHALEPLLAPRLEVACHIAMCVTMAYMLLLMV
jgi:hypothetical protein